MDWLVSLFTNQTFLGSLPGITLFLVACAVLAKVAKVKVHTEHISIGTMPGESKEAYYERKIVQEQCDFAHAYLMGLIGKITDVCPDHQLIHNGWMTKCILEYAYDEFVTWIHYNHISADDAYVSVKQAKICSLIYAQPVRPEFKTPEFQERMKAWVKEIIIELVRIRKVYTEEMKKGDK